MGIFFYFYKKKTISMYIDRIDINEPLGGGIVSRSFKVFNDKDFDEKSLPIKDSIEDLASKGTKVVNSWPVTGHGTHLIMDDKGLKAVTSWDEERGYRRIVYNRDPVLYIEASEPDQVKLNGEMVDLVEGSNYFEVEEITSDSRFGLSNAYGNNNVTTIITRCKLPSVLGGGSSNCPSNGIFAYCKNLQNIELNITNKVTDFNGLFNIDWDSWRSFDSKLRYFNGSSWDTSNVTKMDFAFAYCRQIDFDNIDISNWDTSSVINMTSMFENCSFKTIDISNWNVSNVQNFHTMFWICDNLEELDISNWDVSNASDMVGMFYKCSKLRNINSSLDITFGHDINMYMLCQECISLESFEVPGWVANVNNFYEAFDHCPNLERLDLSGINLSKWTSNTPGNWEVAHYSTKLTYLRFPGLGTYPVGGGGRYIGLNNPLDHDSLMSIFTYDRKSNGLQYITVFLSPTSKSYLTEEEKAEITAKGYTIA